MDIEPQERNKELELSEQEAFGISNSPLFFVLLLA
jgi:hypothetical protein